MHSQSTALIPFVGDRSTISLLREATAPLHQSLHEHPLMVRLLTRPSVCCYRTVLRGFLAFFEPMEPVLMDSSRRLGVPELYRRPDRTKRLSADLETLGDEVPRAVCAHNLPVFPRLTGIGNLAGCLYVINGSALGGQTILRRLSGFPAAQRACRFFTGDGEQTAQNWRDFQQFCNQVCRSDEDRLAAVSSARQTFLSIAQCLTRGMNVCDDRAV
jgi:heme oxygenase